MWRSKEHQSDGRAADSTVFVAADDCLDDCLRLFRCDSETVVLVAYLLDYDAPERMAYKHNRSIDLVLGKVRYFTPKGILG